MYHGPYHQRSNQRSRSHLGHQDFWAGLDDAGEPAVLESTAQRRLGALLLIVIGLGIAAALLLG